MPFRVQIPAGAPRSPWLASTVAQLPVLVKGGVDAESLQARAERRRNVLAKPPG